MIYPYIIFSGSTLNSVPPKQYYKYDKYNNVVGYANNLKEARQICDHLPDVTNRWTQIVCLQTMNIIESCMSFDINKPLYKGYCSDDDEFE